jgi:hypothetical protein
MDNLRHSPMFRWNAENGALLSALHNGLLGRFGYNARKDEIREMSRVSAAGPAGVD